MNDENPMKPSVLLPLIGFGVTLLMAVVVLVLVTTAIIALAEVVGRAWIAALIVAVALLFVSWLIYLLWARASIEYIDRRLNTVYDVATAARNGYQMVRSIALRLLDIVLRS